MTRTATSPRSLTRSAAVFTGKNRYAPWIGGFGTNFTWKGLSVIADFAWAADKWMMQNDDYFIKNANFATTWNQRVEMLNIGPHGSGDRHPCLWI